MATTQSSSSILVRAPLEQVWARLAAFDAIVDWAPNVDHSTLTTLQATGIGAERRVQAGKVVLLEKITVWDAPRQLRYRIEGLPVTIDWLDNEWTLEPAADGTRVTLRTEASGGSRLAKRALAKLIVKKLKSSSEVMLSGLATAVEAERPVR